MGSTGSKQCNGSSQDQPNARLGSWENLPTHNPNGKISEFATGSQPWHHSSSSTVRGSAMQDTDALSMDQDDDDLPIVILPDCTDLNEVPASFLQQLVEYSQRCSKHGDGLKLLTSRGLADADIIAAYSIGYLPADVLDAMPSSAASWITTHQLQDVLIFPAYDEASRVVDALVITAAGQSRSLCAHPRGVLGNLLRTTPQHLVLVRDISELKVQDAQLVRDISDITANLMRFHDSGVQRLRLGFTVNDGVFIALRDACAAVSIQVERGEDANHVPELKLVRHDADTRHAVFSSGSLTISCSIPLTFPASTTLELRCGPHHHRDTFSIMVDAQRERCARAASRRLSLDASTIVHVLAQVAEELQRLAQPGNAASRATTVCEPIADSADVDAILTDADILPRFLKDSTAAGWTGDEQTKRLVLLTLAGRFTERPLWLLLVGSPSDTISILSHAAELVPTAARLQPIRMTRNWFAQQGRDGLHERVLFLDDTESLPREVITNLRRFHARGSLAIPTARQNPTTGRLESVVRDVSGSLGVVAAATGSTPMDDVFIRVSLTRSPQDVATCINAERRRRVSTSAAATPSLASWCAALATIPRLPVATPWMERLVFPATHPNHVRDYNQFCALVEASALLHHRQRTRVDGLLISTDVDVRNAITASAGILGCEPSSLSADAALVLASVPSSGESITLPWLSQQLPNLSPHRLRHSVDELEAVGRITRTHAGRGRKAGTIQRVITDAPDAITLLPPGQVSPIPAAHHDNPFTAAAQHREVAHG